MPPKTTNEKPTIDIDPEQVVNLAKLGATFEEIAAFFHTNPTYIQRYYHAEWVEGNNAVRLSLRRAQLRMAIEKDNVTMLIWLGKQMLGQTDGVQTINTNATLKVDNTEVYESLIAKIKKNDVIPQASNLLTSIEKKDEDN